MSESLRSAAGGRQLIGDWALAVAVSAAVALYLSQHWGLLADPLRQLLEVFR